MGKTRKRLTSIVAALAVTSSLFVGSFSTNTSAATIPLAIWDAESKLKKGDNVIFTAFGAGFVHGASFYKWAYDGAAYGK